MFSTAKSNLESFKSTMLTSDQARELAKDEDSKLSPYPFALGYIESQCIRLLEIAEEAVEELEEAHERLRKAEGAIPESSDYWDELEAAEAQGEQEKGSSFNLDGTASLAGMSVILFGVNW